MVHLRAMEHFPQAKHWDAWLEAPLLDSCHWPLPEARNSQHGTALVTFSLLTASIVFICLFKNSELPFLTRNLNHILFEILQRDVAMRLPFYKLLNETFSSSQLCLKNKGLEHRPVFSRPGRQWARQRILCRANSQISLCMARNSVSVTASSHFAGVGGFGPVVVMIHTNVSTSVVSSLCHSQTSPMLPSSLSANMLAGLCFSFSPQLHLHLEGSPFTSCVPYSS